MNVHAISGCAPNWTIEADLHARGGVSTSAVTVEECRNECIYNGSCTAVDWNAMASAGLRCWLHGSWTSGTLAARRGIQHHVISRTCGQKLLCYCVLKLLTVFIVGRLICQSQLCNN